MEEHMRAVDDLLGELGVAERPTVLAMNKVDRLDTDPTPLVARRNGSPSRRPREQAWIAAAIERALPTAGNLTPESRTATAPRSGSATSAGACWRAVMAPATSSSTSTFRSVFRALTRYRVAELPSVLGMID